MLPACNIGKVSFNDSRRDDLQIPSLPSRVVAFQAEAGLPMGVFGSEPHV